MNVEKGWPLEGGEGQVVGPGKLALAAHHNHIIAQHTLAVDHHAST